MSISPTLMQFRFDLVTKFSKLSKTNTKISDRLRDKTFSLIFNEVNAVTGFFVPSDIAIVDATNFGYPMGTSILSNPEVDEFFCVFSGLSANVHKEGCDLLQARILTGGETTKELEVTSLDTPYKPTVCVHSVNIALRAWNLFSRDGNNKSIRPIPVTVDSLLKWYYNYIDELKTEMTSLEKTLTSKKEIYNSIYSNN